jgi:uncharacterized membrane protein
MIVGWLYVFAGRTGERSVVAASVIDRLLIPAVLIPLILTGVLPHLLSVFAVVDPALGIGAWMLLRSTEEK